MKFSGDPSKKMLTPHYSRTLNTLITGGLIFVIAIVLPKLFIPKGVTSLLATQALELILALSAIIFLGKGKFSDYGFRPPTIDDYSLSTLLKWTLIGAAALGLGAIASFAILLSGAAGNPVVKQLTFPQIILFIWIFSSIIEEIFTRGFIQGHLSPLNDIQVNLAIFRINFPTFAGALFFGAMHSVLFLSGADGITVVITIIFTFLLGLLAGHQRAKSGSLIPAILVHSCANIGGVAGGIVYAIIVLVATGKPPAI